MTDDLILAIDQGTSSTKAVLADCTGAAVSRAVAAVPINYPRPGWAEQSAADIVDSVLDAARACLSGVEPGRVTGIGLSNQRESVLLWDRDTGRAVSPVLSWQDQRTTEICGRLRGDAELIRERSGLPLDPMFSAPKVRWLLDHYDPDRSAARVGKLRLGTVDSWLMYTLAGRHQIETGNAARTQLLDVHSATWDDDLLDLFQIPRQILPEIVASNGDLGTVSTGPLAGLPLRAVLGDSHAALYAHGATDPTTIKVTYGTGSSVMRLIDATSEPANGVCLTIAWASPTPRLAAEGNVRSTGATLTWLSQVLGRPPTDLAELAATSGSDGVHIVPAFGGLAAPWWDDTAVGLIDGITFATGPAQLARAAIESTAFQVADVVATIASRGGRTATIVADGGGSASDALMQCQADLCELPVRRARELDLSALGAARLAGEAAGLCDPASGSWRVQYDEFQPHQATAERHAAWRAAVQRARLVTKANADQFGMFEKKS